MSFLLIRKPKWLVIKTKSTEINLSDTNKSITIEQRNKKSDLNFEMKSNAVLIKDGTSWKIKIGKFVFPLKEVGLKKDFFIKDSNDRIGSKYFIQK